ncbi:hypothetical protein [Chryseobacterium sp. T16E-39]|uniref:hypothetical protein n=1 Tax=Chryseobacterium sp. T16E-39 TaxID=2015076 RepID=UPI0012FB85C6|nr:hypothetical protein [Chryseobacterium sp. T16E-39]
MIAKDDADTVKLILPKNKIITREFSIGHFVRSQSNAEQCMLDLSVEVFIVMKRGYGNF